MFKEAHRLTREDVAYNAELPEVMRKPYAHYFRLHLKIFQTIAKEQRTGMCDAFTMPEPKRVWA